jgi:hypothetical protein
VVAKQNRAPGFISSALFALAIAAGLWLAGPDSSQRTSTRYQKSTDGDYIAVTHGFYDYGSRERQASFRVLVADYESAIDEFGHEPSALLVYVERGLQAAAEDFRKRTGLGFDVYAAAHEEGGLVWGYEYPEDHPECLRFAASLEDLVFALHAGYFATRGFILDVDLKQKTYSLELDYAALATRDKLRLADLVRSFRELAGQLGNDRDRLLAALTAFCQEIPYRIPPDEQNGLTIDGVIVPTQVAVENWGDCDSKSVLFATLWTSLSGERTLLILVPGHMFVAVPGRPRYSTEVGIEYEGRSYLCLEAVGPAKQRPGSIAPDSASHIMAGNYQVIPVD